MYDFIKQNNDNVFWEVPVGLDVYGLDKKKFESWKAKGYTLCITVDCGITNVKEIEELKRLGIDAIIIDHHKPLEILPECAGIVNPKCEKKFEFNDIAACGVVFLFIYGYLIYKSAFFNKKIAVVFSNEGKIIVDIYKNFIFQGTTVLNDIEEVKRTDSDRVYFLTDKSDERGKLINNFHKKSFINILKDKRLFTRLILFNNLLKEIDGLEKIKESYLPFVTLGLIADVMPVIKTNRILISIGLSYIRDKKNYNLTKLFEKANIDISLCSGKDVAWSICPALNASGRIGCADVTVDFLTAKKEVEKKITAMLSNNEERKKKGEEAFNIFIEDLQNNKESYDNRLTFFYSEKIARGITGITATKIANMVNCPVIVAAKEGEYYTGSMRGKSNIHLVDFLNNAKDILEEFGGHKEAAGFRFHENNLSLFKNFLKEKSSLIDNVEPKEEEIVVDAEIPYEYLNFDLFKILNILEPFGEANPSPLFYTENLIVNNYSRMGKNKQHLKLYFKTQNGRIAAVFWNKGEEFEKTNRPSKKYNVFYNLEINKFNDQVIPQMNVISMSESRSVD